MNTINKPSFCTIYFRARLPAGSPSPSGEAGLFALRKSIRLSGEQVRPTIHPPYALFLLHALALHVNFRFFGLRFWFGHDNVEHAVLQLSVNRLLVNAVGQAHRPRKLTGRTQ